MEDRGIKPRRGANAFKENKNVNFVIVKNLKKPASVNINSYIPLLKKHNLLESCDSNVNINVIIIQNVLVEDDIKSGVKIKDNTHRDGDECRVVKRIYNNNINFLIIRNVIPVQKYCCE